MTERAEPASQFHSRQLDTFDLLASLASDDSSSAAAIGNGTKRVTRREELTRITERADSNGSRELAPQEKIAFGQWLQRRYDVLQVKVPDGPYGISEDDVIEAYSSAKWNKTRFMWNDMRMLKRVAGHFDKLALAGLSAAHLDKEDIEGLLGAASVRRSSTEVTSNFPDGRMMRRTARGERLHKTADGSLSYQGGPIAMKLDNATGKGYLGITSPITSVFGGKQSVLEPMKLELTRAKDGTWWGKEKDGAELQMSLDDHSVFVTTAEMEMLMTSGGGYIRNLEHPDFAVYIRPDGTASMTENGKSAEMATNEQGVTRLIENNGTNFYMYPFKMNMRVDPDNAMFISGGAVVPRLNITTAGDMTVYTEDGPSETAFADETGTTTLDLKDGRKVVRSKDGLVTITAAHPIAGDISIKIHRDGKYEFSASNVGEMTFTAPEIRRPK